MNLSITTVDFLVVLVLLVSTGYAVWRGFLWETLTIFAWVAAAFGCLYFGPVILPLTRSMVHAGWLAALTAYAVVFLAVLIPLSFMTHRFSQTVKGSPIGPFDRALGAAFGVVRGLVIAALAYIAFTWFVPVAKQPHWLTEAQTLPMVQDTARVLLSLVPDQTDRDALVPAAPARDAVGDLIRRDKSPESGESVQHKSTASGPGTAAKKRYGAGDRQALDRLIENTGKQK